MKILAINASYRGRSGNTQHLINLLFEGAQQVGASCETLLLSKLKINRCISCYQCQQDNSLLDCVYKNKDDVDSIFNKMASADILVLATPIYIYNISALLKILLERSYGISKINDIKLSHSGLIHHHINHNVNSKPLLPLIVCSNIERETWINAARYFRTYAKFMDAPMVGMLIRNGIDLFSSSTMDQFPAIQNVQQAYIQAGQELARNGKIKWITQKKANQELIPIPFFSLIKNLYPMKKQIVQKIIDMKTKK